MRRWRARFEGRSHLSERVHAQVEVLGRHLYIHTEGADNSAPTFVSEAESSDRAGGETAPVSAW